MKTYNYKICLCDGKWCEGIISVMASSEEEAENFVREDIANRLCTALPELNIEFMIELEDCEESVKLVNVLDTDDYIVDYAPEHKAYRVSIFKDFHWQDEFWFDAYDNTSKGAGDN